MRGTSPIARNAALVGVDWGTSHLRVFALDGEGALLDTRRSPQGMSAVERGAFETVLEDHLTALGIAQEVPVIMCGMVGSRQGWAEAGYLPVPATVAELARHAVRAPHPSRDIRILPGFSKRDERHPEVMRGEETQLVGLASSEMQDGGRMVCMPGTHSKWVHVEGERVTDFVTFMTGDLYAAIAGHSVLRHSLADEAVDPSSAAFLDAVGESLESPADISARLFSIRPAGLLFGLSAADARARLSGLLIGQELAGVRARMTVPATVEVIGAGTLGRLYASALAGLDVTCRFHDGDELVVRGLAASARAIWEPSTTRAKAGHIE